MKLRLKPPEKTMLHLFLLALYDNTLWLERCDVNVILHAASELNAV